MKKLNLGCGSNKIKGFINVDKEPTCKPDLLCDFVKDKLPYKDHTIDEVVMFHTIEHISKRQHAHILNEIWRVLKPGGFITFSYPEFEACVENWRVNHLGRKEFWEATIYGRQFYSSDFHVCIMHTPDFISFLEFQGFTSIRVVPEPDEPWNSILWCAKGEKPPTYEDLMRDHMNKVKFERAK